MSNQEDVVLLTEGATDALLVLRTIASVDVLDVYLTSVAQLRQIGHDRSVRTLLNAVNVHDTGPSADAVDQQIQSLLPQWLATVGRPDAIKQAALLDAAPVDEWVLGCWPDRPDTQRWRTIAMAILLLRDELELAAELSDGQAVRADIRDASDTLDRSLRPRLLRLLCLNDRRAEVTSVLSPERRRRHWWWSELSALGQDVLAQHTLGELMSHPDHDRLRAYLEVDRALQDFLAQYQRGFAQIRATGATATTAPTIGTIGSFFKAIQIGSTTYDIDIVPASDAGGFRIAGLGKADLEDSLQRDRQVVLVLGSGASVPLDRSRLTWEPALPSTPEQSFRLAASAKARKPPRDAARQFRLARYDSGEIAFDLYVNGRGELFVSDKAVSE